MKIENPLIEFTQGSGVCCGYFLPVSQAGDIMFDFPSSVSCKTWLSDPANNLISGSEIIMLSGYYLNENNLKNYFAPGDCFKIALEVTQISGYEEVYFSNLFKYLGCDTKNTHVFRFGNGPESFPNTVRLSCEVIKPQSKTDRVVYESYDGTVKSLSKIKRKSLDMITDFYPEKVHDAIQEMFMFPYLKVDGIDMYESGDYSVDWEGKDEHGKAMATTALSEQKIKRYSIV